MKIRIQNFQPFADASLEVEGLTVIVGPSNRGKSALVRAVEGALFNRPGDGCIRVGAKSAQVTIEGLPNGPASVVWTKGRSTSYQLDGETFGKLSGDSPPALQQAGYRDLWIGDKDRKKGEYLRPQVATQFEPLFLLTRSGGFLADVLNLVTRQRVLTLAQDRCAGDLRSVKQQIGTTETARGQVAVRVEALADVEAFRERVRALCGAEEHLQLLRDVRDRAAQLRVARQGLVGLAKAPRVEAAAFLWSELALLVRRLALLERRQALTAVPALPVVPAAARMQLATLYNQRGRVTVALDTRARLLTIPMTLPEPTAFHAAWQQTAALRANVGALVAQRAHALFILRNREAAASAAAVEVEQLEAQLHGQLDALDVCPLCERVMGDVPETQSTR